MRKIDELCEHVIDEYAEHWQNYLDGEETALNFLVGRAMNISKGRADPGEVYETFREMRDEATPQTTRNEELYRSMFCPDCGQAAISGMQDEDEYLTERCECPNGHTWSRNILGNPEVVCLCGSTRFKDEYRAENRRLTMEGKIVLSVGLFGHADDVELSDGQKEMLDYIHKRKIDIADRVHVIDVDGYIGDSTQSEIEYAEANDTPVTYYSNRVGGDDA